MRTKDLVFQKMVGAINSIYNREDSFNIAKVVRSYYKGLSDVDQLKQCREWIDFVIIDYPFNEGLYSTRRAIQSRIDSLSSTSTNK